MKVMRVTKPADQVSESFVPNQQSCPGKDPMDVTHAGDPALIQHQVPHGTEPSSVGMWNRLPGLPEPGGQAHPCDQVRRVLL